MHVYMRTHNREPITYAEKCSHDRAAKNECGRPPSMHSGHFPVGETFFLHFSLSLSSLSVSLSLYAPLLRYRSSCVTVTGNLAAGVR